jgi:hypothetical protein
MAPYLREALYGDDGVFCRCGPRYCAIPVRHLGMRVTESSVRVHTSIQTIPADIFQSQRAASLLPALAAPTLELCSSPSTSSPRHRSFAWQGAEDDGERTAWSTHSLLLQPDRWETTGYVSTAVRLHRHPERRAVLDASVSVQCHPSSYFPAHPRSLASVLIPRHITPVRNERVPGPRFCGTSGSAFSGLLPQPDALGPRSRKCTFGLGSGAHSRRFAQECPEGNPGKYKQGETKWHSTKTTSS